jgi:hypothetical protein
MMCRAARIEGSESSHGHFGGAVADEKTEQSQSFSNDNAKLDPVRTTNVWIFRTALLCEIVLKSGVAARAVSRQPASIAA